MMNENVSMGGISMTQNTNFFSKLSTDIFLKDTCYYVMLKLTFFHILIFSFLLFCFCVVCVFFFFFFFFFFNALPWN